MSDIDDDKSEMKEMMNKMTRYNKNIKSLMDIMTKALEKLDEVLKRNLNQIKNDDNDDKEKMDKIFAKKSIGRPTGSFEDKQKQYLKMLNENKIKQPKGQTLDYYRIQQMGDKYVLMD